MKKLVEDENFTIAVSNERHISLEAATFDKLLPHIFRRGWVLLKAPREFRRLHHIGPSGLFDDGRT